MPTLPLVRSPIASGLLVAAAIVPPPDSRSPIRAPASDGGRAIAAAVLPTRADSLRAAIARRVDGDRRPASVDAARWPRVRRLYLASGSGPLWLGADGAQDRADALARLLADAHEDGLDPSRYRAAELRDALAAASAGLPPSVERLAELDLRLTGAFVALGEDLLEGQVDPATVGQRWAIERREPGADDLLLEAVRQPSLAGAVAGLRPADAEYEALRAELARHRRIVAAGGWSPVPAGQTLAPGDTSTMARLGALHDRLRAAGDAETGLRVTPLLARDAAGPAARAVYDASLAGAVFRFQARHGIVADSIVGPETLGALNVTARYRLGQLAANLERHRWLPRTPPERYVAVNVPAFRLRAVEHGREALVMRVIVGAAYDDRDTPTFEALARAVIFRPYWNVPDRIAANEVWPKQRRDPSYFARNHFEVVWRDGGRRVRQRPGPENALGLMKLDLPNRFSIYLHDTPTTALFRQDVRAFSHGCIRVEQPAALAAWALGWDAEQVRQAMHEGADDQRVELARPVPIRVVYLTAYTSGGALYFGNDVYGRDPALVSATAGGALAGAVGVRASSARIVTPERARGAATADGPPPATWCSAEPSR